MSALLYLIGFIIGVAVFIYLYSAYRSGRDKIDAFRARKKPPATTPVVNPDFVDYFNIKRPPGARLCPLCGKELTKYEALYA